MKLCIKCKFYNKDDSWCNYYRLDREILCMVTGRSDTIIVDYGNNPRRMRLGLTFPVFKWKNCGTEAKFWKPIEKESLNE